MKRIELGVLLQKGHDLRRKRSIQRLYGSGVIPMDLTSRSIGQLRIRRNTVMLGCEEGLSAPSSQRAAAPAEGPSKLVAICE